MEKNAKLRINNPCSENWDAMKLGINSRHCTSCNKSVVDFTKKSKKEIFEYLNKNQSASICGRVRSNHLDFELTPEEIIINNYNNTSTLFKNTPLYLCTIAATLVLSSCYDSNMNYLKYGIENIISPNQDSISGLEKVQCETGADIIKEEMFTITMGVVISDTDFKEPYHQVDKQPEFIGGREKLKSYFEKSLSSHKPTGKIYCSFVVDKTGKTKNVLVRTSNGNTVHKKIIETIKNMPDWLPTEKKWKNCRILLCFAFKIRIARILE